MAWARNRGDLTPADVGGLMGVSFRTVIGWIQRERLNAYQLPGCGYNRVKIEDLLGFIKENNMPIPPELINRPNRILIVENDTAAVAAIEHVLRGHFDTLVARTGFEAGKLATAFMPAVVITDPEMKELGGLAMIRALSDDPALFSTRVLVVSAAAEGQLEAALEAGAWAVMSKPFNNHALAAAVVRLCNVDT